MTELVDHPDSREANASALHEMEVKIDQLPLLPQVLMKILQLDSDEDYYFEQLATLAKEDPALAVRVLALANSAASSPMTEIKSIKNALMRIGAETVRSLVSSLAVQRVFMPVKDNQIRLWVHSVIVAVGTQRIVDLLPQLQLNTEAAYLTGLLHDVGRFVMFEHASADLLEVDERHWHSPDELIEAEIEAFKYTHSELGFLACQHWGMPEDIAQVIRAHHTVLPAKIRPGSNDALTSCVQMADRLSVSVLEKSNFSEMSGQDRESRISEYCLQASNAPDLLSAQQLNEVVGDIHEESETLLAGLGFHA